MGFAKTPLRILIAEDSEHDVLFLMEELRHGGYEAFSLRVDTAKALAEALSEGRWDLVISDLRMPQLSGLEVIKAVKESGLDLPVIIVSGVMGEDYAVTAMKAGADDYILKDKLYRLVPAVERELKEYRARESHRKAEEEIRLLNKLLQTITEVDKMIVRETARERILSEACRILVEEVGFSAAWVGMADLRAGTVTQVAFAGLNEACFNDSSILCDISISGNGPTGRAIRSGKHVICPDVDADESFSPWREEAGKHGFKACAAFPLHVRGRVVGNISVYAANDALFSGKIIRLLDGLVADIGFALQSMQEAEGRKKAVLALRDSEERLRTIFESSMDGMFVIDLTGRYLDVNCAGCHMFGYGRDEILSSDVSLLIYPESIKYLEEHKKHWRKGAFIPEIRMRKKDGSEIWVDLAITPFRVGDKDLVLGVKRDITARRHAEEALRESEERFREMFEQNQDAQLILSHRECGIVEANPAASALFGFSRAELAKSGRAPFFSAESHERWCGAIKDFLRAGKSFSIERAEAVKKDGTRVTVSIRGQMIRLKDSHVVLCTVRDQTEMLSMEDEARYIQSKLIHANKMTSIGTLASGVAHEINNPNNFILFNSALLMDAWKDAVKVLEQYYRENGDFSLGGLPFSEMREVVPDLLTGITDGSRRIKGIVDNLKDFSRMDKSGLEGELDVNRAVMASASMLNNQISKYTDNFIVECADGLPSVKGSAQKIEQVVINLIINALHALPDKKRGIFVKTYYDGGKRQVIIEVSDEGAGMTKEVLERITEPFFTTRSDKGGTGLGLSISYTIVKEHKGSLEFDSTPGRGTTVKVRLPAAQAPLKENEDRWFR